MKTLLITGAGKGIGFEVAKLAANSDLNVIALSRSIESLQSINNITSLPTDLRNPLFFDSLKPILADVKIDFLINNAGLLINKSFQELTDLDWQTQWETNVLGPVRLIRNCIPYLANPSHIVNISSMGGFQGSSKFAGLSAYSTTKGALNTLTECLSEETEFLNTSINSLCLGAVQTEMLNQAFPGYKASISASSIAEYILHFTQTAGKYLNGKIIPVSKSNPN